LSYHSFVFRLLYSTEVCDFRCSLCTVYTNLFCCYLLQWLGNCSKRPIQCPSPAQTGVSGMRGGCANKDAVVSSISCYCTSWGQRGV